MPLRRVPCCPLHAGLRHDKRIPIVPCLAQERFEAASVAKAVDASALERQPATGGAGAKEEKAERPVVHTALMAYLRDQR